jgi:predicted DNA-binding transcriptional regulator YafY
MSDALQRQWKILQSIPRAPAKIGVSALGALLTAAGYTVEQRTLRRDLNELSRVFPLQCDTKTTPSSWFWAEEGAVLDIPRMDGVRALSTLLIERVLAKFAPPGLCGVLAPEFAHAEALLVAPVDRKVRWTEYVRVVPHELSLLAPKVNDDVARTVFRGLLDGKRLHISYKRQTTDGNGEQQYEINLLGLVIRGRVIQLIFTPSDSTTVGHLLLHRVTSATLSEIAAVRPNPFDLDKHLLPVDANAVSATMIDLRLKLARSVAAPLYETPLSADQAIEENGSEYVIVSASVPESGLLTAWLLGFGEFAEVLKPEALRQSIERSHRLGAQRYTRRSP